MNGFLDICESGNRDKFGETVGCAKVSMTHSHSVSRYLRHCLADENPSGKKARTCVLPNLLKDFLSYPWRLQ